MKAGDREFFRVILSSGKVVMPCVSHPCAAAYVRTWNGLAKPGQPTAEVQPLEDRLVMALFLEPDIAHT